MITTLDEILQKTGQKKEKTIYLNDNRETCEFKISAGDFFELKDAQQELLLQKQKPESAGECEVCQQLEEQLEKISAKIKSVKAQENANKDEILRRLRQQKKQLCEQLEGQKKATKKIQAIEYKKCITMISFEMLQKNLPDVKNVKFPYRDAMPVFEHGLHQLKQVRAEGRPLGIIGGPCLFGVSEVIVVIHLKNGSEKFFDFSSGRNHLRKNDEVDLTEYFYENAKEIDGINFINHKKYLTAQEYDSILYLFEYARALDAKITIPIPDMSYIKFFSCISENLTEEIRQDALDKFRKIAWNIADLYLKVIKEIAANYPEIEIAVLHERDKELLEKYYKGREKFLTSESLIRKVTRVRGKTGAVLDYITMPALPYYIWGIRDILEIDSLDETDSYRKCVKLHKNEVTFYALMYPERISSDGQNTIYYAEREYKEYLVEERK